VSFCFFTHGEDGPKITQRGLKPYPAGTRAAYGCSRGGAVNFPGAKSPGDPFLATAISLAEFFR